MWLHPRLPTWLFLLPEQLHLHPQPWAASILFISMIPEKNVSDSSNLTSHAKYPSMFRRKLPLWGKRERENYISKRFTSILVWYSWDLMRFNAIRWTVMTPLKAYVVVHELYDISCNDRWSLNVARMPKSNKSVANSRYNNFLVCSVLPTLDRLPSWILLWCIQCGVRGSL